MKIEIISKENIKPSSPTPDHLTQYKFSFLDQIQPPVFMPLTLFYPNTTNLQNAEKASRIKQSLSETLSLYYPVAGRVVSNDYIDCNDTGVYYVEAKTDSSLSDILENPNPTEMNRFIPLELDEVGDLAAIFQVTFFSCGGIAIAFAMSHKVGDASSYINFLNTWAAGARGDGATVSPIFDSASYFPPAASLSGFQTRTGIVKDNIVTKRFVIDAANIKAIRAKYTVDETNYENAQTEKPRPPTRVEALSAFVWSRFMASTQLKSKSDTEKTYTILHAVNLRSRMDPPLPDNQFGNMSRLAISVPSSTSSENGGDFEIVDGVRNAIKEINPEFVKKIQDSDAHLSFLKQRSAAIAKGEVVSFSFTSLCRFPIYEADFGWGKPCWVSSATLTFKNLVTFFDTKFDQGIEIWINLKEDDMVEFENDPELLAYVSPSVSVKV